MEFKPWPKITRVEKRRSPVFTEKLDGTNACIVWSHTGQDENTIALIDTDEGPMFMWAQSRTRFITPNNDNYGFAKWAVENKEELASLGVGYHYGEWWGQGIQRTYGLEEKKFSLFNILRWGENPNTPACVDVVPIIPFDNEYEVKEYLITNGSVAVPGYMKPEGAIMFDLDTETYFKIIIDK